MAQISPNDYDTVARLLSTTLKNSGGTNLDSYTYTYNAAGTSAPR